MIMEPFTLATGIVGILSLCIQITDITKEYVSSATQAHKEAEDLARQTEALSDVLKKLVEFLRSDAVKDISFEPNSGLNLALGCCQTQLESLYKKLKKQNAQDKNKLVAVWDRLMWPLDKKDCVEIIRRLQECAQTFHFCLTITNWCVSRVSLESENAE
jgi:hypothetical protein